MMRAAPERSSRRAMPRRLETKTLIGCALLLVVLLAAGCGGSSPTATPAPTPEAPGTPAPGVEPTDTAAANAGDTATATPTPDGGTTATSTPSSGRTGTTPEPTPSSGQPQPNALAIDMSSTATQARPGQEFSVDVTADPKGRGISGAEFQLIFNPAFLQVLEVVPGDVLGEKTPEVESVLPFVHIDNDSGIVQYRDARIGLTEPPTPRGLLATVKLVVQEDAPPGAEASLRIVEAKIPDENIEEIGELVVGGPLTVEISR